MCPPSSLSPSPPVLLFFPFCSAPTLAPPTPTPSPSPYPHPLPLRLLSPSSRLAFFFLRPIPTSSGLSLAPTGAASGAPIPVYVEVCTWQRQWRRARLREKCQVKQESRGGVLGMRNPNTWPKPRWACVASRRPRRGEEPSASEADHCGRRADIETCAPTSRCPPLRIPLSDAPHRTGPARTPTPRAARSP